MMEKEYERGKKAYEEYNVNEEYLIEEKVVEYILERIKENKEEIEEILKICKRKIGYEQIEKAVEEEVKKKGLYKKQVNIRKREDGFVRGEYLTSIGVVVVESYETEEVVRYMIRGVKTRNAVIIADVEYEEKDDKHVIMLIIKEALKKYGIDENLVQIEPYEECSYEKCEKVIYTYSGKENKEKRENEKLYVYIENEEQREEGIKEYEYERKKGKEVELIEGKMEEAIEKINKEISQGAVIYTKEGKKGYRFINLVRSRNVHVNTTLENIEKVEKSKEELLINKKIMYELKI